MTRTASTFLIWAELHEDLLKPGHDLMGRGILVSVI